MNIRILSDLHLEFSPRPQPVRGSQLRPQLALARACPISGELPSERAPANKPVTKRCAAEMKAIPAPLIVRAVASTK
jgi:hypothetical protein